MRIPRIVAAIAAILALTLAGCSSGSNATTNACTKPTAGQTHLTACNLAKVRTVAPSLRSPLDIDYITETSSDEVVVLTEHGTHPVSSARAVTAYLQAAEMMIGYRVVSVTFTRPPAGMTHVLRFIVRFGANSPVYVVRTKHLLNVAGTTRYSQNLPNPGSLGFGVRDVPGASIEANPYAVAVLPDGRGGMARPTRAAAMASTLCEARISAKLASPLQGGSKFDLAPLEQGAAQAVCAGYGEAALWAGSGRAYAKYMTLKPAIIGTTAYRPKEVMTGPTAFTVLQHLGVRADV